MSNGQCSTSRTKRLCKAKGNQNFNFESYSWSTKSRLRLLKALKERGTFDFNYLEEKVQNKSKDEIKFHLARRRVMMRHYLSQSVEIKNLENQPINCWIKLIQMHKASDSIIPEIIEDYISKREFSNQPNEPNFRRIYEYIVICLNGGVLPILSPIDSYVVIMLVQRIQKKLKSRPDIKRHISKIVTTSSDKNAQHDEDIDSSENSENVISTSQPSTSGLQQENPSGDIISNAPSSSSSVNNIASTSHNNFGSASENELLINENESSYAKFLAAVSNEQLNPFQIPKSLLTKR